MASCLPRLPCFLEPTATGLARTLVGEDKLVLGVARLGEAALAAYCEHNYAVLRLPGAHFEAIHLAARQLDSSFKFKAVYPRYFCGA
jgi:hypothetical protein